MRLALVLLLVACSSKKAEQAPPPAKLDTLTVTVDGKPLPIDRAFLRQTSPDAHAVILGNGQGSCTENGTLGFTLAKRLAPTGHERHHVTQLWSRDVDPQLAGAPTAELADDMTIRVKLATPKLTLDGAFQPTVCPITQPTGLGAPKMTHKSSASITVATQRLPIKGVTVRARAGVAATDLPDITISTNVLDCSSVTLPAPVLLARTDGKWTMQGTYFEGELAETESSLAFTANAVGTSPDGPTLELQLSGSAKLGDYSVKLDGTVEAIECVR